MVYYSKQADNDLDGILEGLLTWPKCVLTREFCLKYLSDIIDCSESLSTITFHFNAVYKTHKRYGKKVFKYSRNKATSWYIIYDVDSDNNIFINRIISNYQTIS